MAVGRQLPMPMPGFDDSLMAAFAARVLFVTIPWRLLFPCIAALQNKTFRMCEG
jgi:hypothetical protein